MQHSHSKDQKTCQICVENEKERLANQMFRIMRSAAMMLELRIQLALLTMFTPAKLKPEPSAKQKDGTRSDRRTKRRK